MKKPLTKFELYRRMERFANDDKRLLSWRYFAELAGVDMYHLREVFLYKTKPLTAHVQLRVSKALERMANGDVTLMHNRDNSRFLQYNNEPKPRMVRASKLVMQNGKIVLSVGPQNRGDYSEPTLQEQMGTK